MQVESDVRTSCISLNIYQIESQRVITCIKEIDILLI
jgi:hypothetical protein